MSAQLYFNIYKYGKYYNPASKHYNDQSIVRCDRCKDTNILVCVGLKDKDLCMKCMARIDVLINERKQSSSISRVPFEGNYAPVDFNDFVQDFNNTIDHYPPLTKMVQNIFKDGLTTVAINL